MLSEQVRLLQQVVVVLGETQLTVKCAESGNVRTVRRVYLVGVGLRTNGELIVLRKSLLDRNRVR